MKEIYKKNSERLEKLIKENELLLIVNFMCNNIENFGKSLEYFVKFDETSKKFRKN